jgi:hypothetical protein
VDKPVLVALPDGFPSYDPALTFGKFYPPPQKDLTDDKQLPSRNIFDELLRDIECIKGALYRETQSFSIGRVVDVKKNVIVEGEEWPLPKTIVVEGMDFVRDHCVNWILHTQGKHHMDEFTTADGRPNLFLGWGLVAAKMEELFANLAFLPSIAPVNVVVTIGLDEEKKRQSVNGKMEIVSTGLWDPAFGGKMSLEAPRKFRDCWLTERVASKYFVHTASTPKTEKFRGLRSGRHGLQTVEDVTIAKPYINQWQRLFGGVK